MKMARWDCEQWFRNLDLPVDIRDTAPEEWEQAVQFDEANRNNPLAERGSPTADELYIYRAAQIPLAEASLESDAEKERRKYGVQLPMFGCESGFCGV